MMSDETICAPATPPVHSPIAIIRISGPDSIRVVSEIFSAAHRLAHRGAVYGTIRQNELPVDDVIVTCYEKPGSYTGEEMVEISCHGNPLIVNRILAMLTDRGCRLAEPGEFTRRAFQNGKMDLTEAEAIHHIITARSEWEIESAVQQMHGSLREKITKIREELILLKADVECGIDFIEDDVEIVSNEEAARRIDKVAGMIEDVFQRCKTGETISHGIDCAIVGKPNVGKSSLLNCILNNERAIVSDIPGTTRDIIRESVSIRGLQLNIIDTAGINDSSCEIEKIGVELSLKNLQQTDLVLIVLDAVTGITNADERILEAAREKTRIFIINKMDRANDGSYQSMAAVVGEEVIPFSALKGDGLDVLEKKIVSVVQRDFVHHKNSFLADFRMLSLLQKALQTSDNLKKLFQEKEPPEIAAFELQSMIDYMSAITGEITPDDVLNSIFSRFCIGK
ncbi:MAG: tRNA uridine-5-carboxymethylaminomethyl(34) synthesis GTPase MnmE [Spirochaetota bacterium]